jgi:hypothetical protein
MRTTFLGRARMMVSMRAPSGLGRASRALWREVTAEYGLNPAELESLRQAARVADVLARLDAEMADAPVTVSGSMGQLWAHPLLQVSADQRRVLDGLLRSLALPMQGEDVGRRRSPTAREAANARWRGHGVA